MRRTPILLALLVASLGLPASEAPKDTTRPVRTEKGEPRVRDAAKGRAASERVPAPGRTRPYQPAKPGEGAPKD